MDLQDINESDKDALKTEVEVEKGSYIGLGFTITCEDLTIQCMNDAKDYKFMAV